MKKVTKVIKTVECEDYYCDVCGNKINSYDLKFCDVCDRHLCVNCTIRSEDMFDGDSPSYYCGRCWNIGDIYRGDIAEEKAKCDRNIKAIEDMWRNAAKGDTDDL